MWFRKTLSANPQSADATLLAQLKAGQPQAVQAWYEQYAQRVLRIVSARVKSESDAEEITQDVFLSCLKHLPLFRGESSIWTWMQRIINHEVADYYRKYYAKKTIHALPLGEFLLANSVKDAHQTAELVKQTLQHLPSEMQELLFLKYVDRKRVKEIARQLGKSAKAIESDLFRARRDFRDVYVALAAAGG